MFEHTTRRLENLLEHRQMLRAEYAIAYRWMLCDFRYYSLESRTKKTYLCDRQIHAITNATVYDTRGSSSCKYPPAYSHFWIFFEIFTVRSRLQKCVYTSSILLSSYQLHSHQVRSENQCSKLSYTIQTFYCSALKSNSSQCTYSCDEQIIWVVSTLRAHSGRSQTNYGTCCGLIIIVTGGCQHRLATRNIFLSRGLENKYNYQNMFYQKVVALYK